MVNPNPYEYKPEIKWYNVVWDLRNGEFRKWWTKNKQREIRMFWKYESHRFWEKMGLAALLAGMVMYACGTDLAVALIRWPTEDPNELLKQRVWQERKNEVNIRQERASKVLEDSNYIHNKNNPTA